MNNQSHLIPIPGQAAPPAVDESVTMDNRLEGKEAFFTKNSQENLEWLKDAGFGLFIHWSLDVQLGCVISHSLVGASDDYVDRYYKELPKTLNPGHWDFDRLAELSRLAGMRYAVFTTKHHNGFCLWDTKTTDFSIVNTPYGKDLVRQYAEAFRRQGLKVGFYFSPEDFCYLRQAGQTITRTPKEPYPTAVREGYESLLNAQMTELMTLFGTVDILFFDGGETMYNENGESLQQLCMKKAWELQPNVLVTRGAIPTPEQQLPGVGAEVAWEGCITLGTAWQYQPTNETYKTGNHVIRLLMETRAKGGSLLLNIAPDSDGGLCRQQEGVLREVALWHFINQESVHHVRPWTLTNEDSIWLLRSKEADTVYAVLFDVEEWSRGVRKEFLIKSVKAAPRTVVEVLGQSGELTEYRPDLDVHTYWEQREEGLYISAVHAQRIYCGIQWRNPLVLKITHAQPAYEPMSVQTFHEGLSRNGESMVLAARVDSLGSFDNAGLSFEYRVYPGFALSSYETGWQCVGGITVTAPGTYTCAVPGLASGITYQYRAIVANSMNRMRGEMHLFVMD